MFFPTPRQFFITVILLIVIYKGTFSFCKQLIHFVLWQVLVSFVLYKLSFTFTDLFPAPFKNGYKYILVKTSNPPLDIFQIAFELSYETM
jgi:uncharacterized membrane protein